MLDTVIRYIPVLGVLIAVNIALGLYNNIENICEAFDWRKLVKGIVKALCISGAFIGLAYSFDVTGTSIDLGVFDIDPEAIMISAIILYLGKGLQNLASILGVGTKKE